MAMPPLTLPGISWPLDATVGHIAVASSSIAGHFKAGAGLDALIECDLHDAGKFRNGAPRQWCRSHQCYWGVNADLAALEASGTARCKLHDSAMGYLLYPEVFDPARHHAISLAAGDDGLLHLRARSDDGGALMVRTALALAIDCRALPGLFHPSIVQINLTPPAAAAYLQAVQQQAPLGCSDCARCGHPHLDLGDFALAPHRRHYCGNCGHDATHSAQEMVSTPLQRLRQHALATPQRWQQWF